METETIKTQGKTSKKEKHQIALYKKIDPESAKILEGIRERVNKKQYGRKINDAEIIAVALKLVTTEAIKELQERTYNENDRLHLIHDEYQKTNGKISLDQFIGRLIRGEINLAKKEKLEI